MADSPLAIDALISTSDGEFTQDALLGVWEALALTTDEAGYVAFEDAFLAAIDGSAAEVLRFRPGGWVVNASGASVKAALTTALLTLALAAGQASGIPLLVIPTVLPMLVDIEKVRLTKSDEHILAELVFTSAGRSQPADSLYDSLPETTRDEISRLAFRDFLEKCRQAGLADEEVSIVGGGGSTFRLRALGSERFRVTFR